MFSFKAVSLVLPLVISGVAGLDLDVNNQDSIKSAAKTLAAGIVAKYDADLKNTSIPGLFDGYYFWESGTMWNALLGYSHLTGDKQYDTKISEALYWQKSALDNFMPPNQTRTLANDDQSCWGLAAMTAAEVGLPKAKDKEWIEYATNVWESQAVRSDFEQQANGTCGRGLRWQIFSFNLGYSYKNTWSNGNFFLLSARLAKFTGNSTFAQYADKSYQWASNLGLVTDSFEVFAGTEIRDGACKNRDRLQFSAVHGIYTEGAALMYNMTGGAQNWTKAVNGFVNASKIFQSFEDNPVLIEAACESNGGRCDVDQRAYKGVFARTFARAAVAAPMAKDAINKVLTASAKAAAQYCEGSGDTVKCPLAWREIRSPNPKLSAKDGNLGEVFNALEVVQGLLYPQAKALNTNPGAASGGNASQSGTPTGSGAQGPQSTGAAGMVAVNLAAVLIGAFFTALNL